jgi:hypothetical protein
MLTRSSVVVTVHGSMLIALNDERVFESVIPTAMRTSPQFAQLASCVRTVRFLPRDGMLV